MATPAAADTFVTLRDSSLWLGSTPYRFASFNCPELLSATNTFEIQDTMDSLSMPGSLGRPVTRTYTLMIKSQPWTRDGHINGWDGRNWIWSEAKLQTFDRVLDEARKRGVKLIIPIINQDFGSVEQDFVGNFTDLVMMRKGISNYKQAQQQIDFWSDPEMIDSFKLIIDTLSARINSVNGVKYADDATILAWETGNELNSGGYSPAPASWTLTVAAYLKTKFPKHLVMDGSFGRTTVRDSYRESVLQSPNVDLFSYHFYGWGEASRVINDIRVVNSYGKAYVAGEYGFFPDYHDNQRFLDLIKDNGGERGLSHLVSNSTLPFTDCTYVAVRERSLRPHSNIGGFKIHSEDQGFKAYHVPGWWSSNDGFNGVDGKESDIVSYIRRSSFAINNEPTPKYPTPKSPSVLWINNQGQLSFQGSAWGKSYNVLITNTSLDGRSGQRTLDKVEDCYKAGSFNVNLGNLLGDWPRDKCVARVQAVGADGDTSDWSNGLRVATNVMESN